MSLESSKKEYSINGTKNIYTSKEKELVSGEYILTKARYTKEG